MFLPESSTNNLINLPLISHYNNIVEPIINETSDGYVFQPAIDIHTRCVGHVKTSLW